MRIRMFLLMALAFLASSCGKEAAVDNEMEKIAGEYKLTQYCINSKQQMLPDGVNYSDLKAEIVKTDGQWYFNFSLPIMHGEESCTYHKVEQPIAWSPLLNTYVVVGEELSFASKTGLNANNALLYFNTDKNKIGLDVFGSTGLEKWYHWTKK